MKDTKIQWAHHTFNGWWGCERVGPECDNCYAEAFAHRLGLELWGHNTKRRFFSNKHWNEPLKWDRAAAKIGERHRVFCSSMADVLEDRRDLDPWRERLWALIEATPNLDWMLLTKRPANFARLTPERWRDGFPPNVWPGTTAGTQRTADVLIPQLKRAALSKASVLFVSAEPLLEAVDYGRVLHGVRLLILGGESGPKARPMDLAWVRAAMTTARGVACAPFVKQVGARPYDGDSLGAEQYEAAWKLKDSHGGDPEEWPEDLRVRELPATGRA